MGLNQGPLVLSLFVIFIYVPESKLLVFLRIAFSHQQELNPKVVDSFQYFCAQIEVWDFPPKFKNQFYNFIHKHSRTVYCDQAHYGTVSGGGAETRALGIQKVVKSRRGGCGGDAEGGSGGRMDGGGGRIRTGRQRIRMNNYVGVHCRKNNLRGGA